VPRVAAPREQPRPADEGLALARRKRRCLQPRGR
jgi:hypothetical protein